MADNCIKCGIPLAPSNTTNFCSEHQPDIPSSPDGTKQCPFCAETILFAAIKCKHCGEFLDESLKHHSSSTETAIANVDTTLTPGELWNGFNLQSMIICPNCNKKGCVVTRTVKKKSGISGAKATGAILTGGLSLFAFGLSKKDMVTEAKCKNCNSVWTA